MTFDEKLLELRKKNNMSQEDLADALQVSRQTVYRWEKGMVQPSTEMLIRLSEIYNVSFNSLIGKQLADHNDNYKNERTDEISSEDFKKMQAHTKIYKCLAIVACALVLILSSIVYWLLTKDLPEKTSMKSIAPEEDYIVSSETFELH